ncbi:MAG: hypothetical protein AAB426_12155 [Myxococcota bacterium]
MCTRLVGVVVLLGAGGCLSTTMQASGVPTGKPLGMRSVAVATLVNRTASPQAAAVARDLLIERLGSRTTLRTIVVPPELGVDPERFDRTRAQEIAVKLGVDGILVGTVFAFEYTEGRTNPGGLTTPVVHLDLRLIAASTGTIVWAATARAEKSLLFTYDSAALSEAAGSVVAQLTDDLAGRI